MKYKSKIYRKFVFSHKFFRFLLLDRVMIEKDNIILVTGFRGQGKTTFALKMILGFTDAKMMEEEYNKELQKTSSKDDEEIPYKQLRTFQAFSIEKDMAFQRKELQDLCRNLMRGFILADEAVVNAGRRNSMTKANKILHQIITINRKNYNSVFFCLPSVEDFDVSILQYVSCWVHIDDRGLGAILLPNATSIFGRKSWDVDKMKKTYDKFLDENPRTTQVPYWLFDNFRGYIKFKKLPKGIEEKYLKIAHEKKNAEMEDEDKKAEPKRKFTEEQETLLNNLTQKLIKGEIDDPSDFYKHCGDLDFSKNRINRVIGELLAKSGDGRTPTQIIRDTKNKNEQELEGDNVAFW